jgi:hypothetical protein
MKPIKITTQMDFNSYENFFIFSLFKNKLYNHIKITFFIPFAALLLIGLIMLPFNILGILPYILIIISLFISILFIYVFFYVPKFRYKRVPDYLKTPLVFVFHDDFYEISSDGNTMSGFTKMSFDELFRFYETKDAFYIFVSKSQSYVIPKKQIPDGRINDTRDVIIKKIDAKKYIKCFKSKT